MEKVNLICIGCPMGCPLEAALEGGAVVSVTGNACPRGDAYARKEVVSPTRIVTSTVRVSGSKNGVKTVPCKTQSDVPKGKIMEVMRALRGVAVAAPVKSGSVLLENVAETGVPVIATADAE